MNGKRFFERMESTHPGFLQSAYHQISLEYTTHNDGLVAKSLAPAAAAMGCARLTGDMVQEARLTLGLKARNGSALAQATAPEATVASPPVVAQPGLFPSPGEERIAKALDSIGGALWAIRALLAREMPAGVTSAVELPLHTADRDHEPCPNASCSHPEAV